MSDATEEHDELIEQFAGKWLVRADAQQLFESVRDPMRQAARRALWNGLSERPDEQDVDDAVFRAFKQLMEKDLSMTTNVIGLAMTIAKRRGQDRSREIVRARNRLRDQSWRINNDRIERSDIEAASAEHLLLTYAEDCMRSLSEDHLSVIVDTVMELRSLSDWALERGVSYEAARRMRERAMKNLERCVSTKQHEDSGEN
jgi:DNA-directed RNA polymerase specialized sigma24 family protein